MSYSLDPDQAQHFVRHDLDPNCLSYEQMTKVGTSGERVKAFKHQTKFIADEQMTKVGTSGERVKAFKHQTKFIADDIKKKKHKKKTFFRENKSTFHVPSRQFTLTV